MVWRRGRYHSYRLQPVPTLDSAWGYVDLPHGLRTRYGQQLAYRNGMNGTAEIITADRCIAERLMNIVKDGGK